MAEDEKFKEIVQEHPYLLDDIYKISRTKAMDIYKKGFPDAAELLAGAKEKYKELQPEGWALFDKALEQIEAEKSKSK